MKLYIKESFFPLLEGFRIILVFICFMIIILPSVNDIKLVNFTITSKLIYFLYGSIILLGSYSLTIIFSKKISFSFSKIDIALFFLVLYMSLNRYFIQSRYGFSIRYIELLGLSFFYLVLRTIGVKYYSWVLLSVIMSGIIQAVYGNLQLLGFFTSNHSLFKMTGGFFNPGPYAGFLVSVWTVALGMYLFKDNINNQVQSQIKIRTPFFNESIKYVFEYIPLLGIISIAIVLPALQSRASWIAAILSSSILLELRYHFLKSLLKIVIIRSYKVVIISVSIAILCVGIFSLYQYKKGSSDGRVFIWKVTNDMIIDHPVFGVGFDRFNAYYMNYQANYFAKKGETLESLVADNTYYTFSEGLQFVSENGLLGLILLVIVVYVLFQTKINEKHQLQFFIAKTGLLTIGVFACFSYPMQILPIKLVLVILLALLSYSTTEIFQFKILNPQPSPKKSGIAGTIGILCKSIIILIACVTMLQIFTYTKALSQGFITWNNALASHQYGDYEGAIQKYEKVYPIFNKNGEFLMNYGKTLSMTDKPQEAIIVLKQAQNYQNNTIIATALGDSYKATRQYDKAEASYKQAVYMTPSKFYANYLLAKLYDDSGQNKKAIAMANKLMHKEIKIPSKAINEINEEMKNILIKYKNSLKLKNK